jgi:LPS sulfotransferase NodH
VPGVEDAGFVVMLARQRSGTNALQSVLDTHPEICCSREIFHTEPDRFEHLDPATNWFRYLHRAGADAMLAALTSADVLQRTFAEYLGEVAQRLPGRVRVLDVKYNSTRNLDGPWQPPTGPPALFGFIRRHRLRVLQLRRRNHVRSWISLRSAQRSGEWLGARGGAPGEHVPLHVDTDELLKHLHRSRAEDELVERSFPEGPMRLSLEYEELFPRLGGPAAAGELSRLARWLGVADAFVQQEPEYRKQSVRPLREEIANYDEVEAAVAGTDFAACLEDERAYRGG